jgi:ABC-type uncharacterized transport system ATPase subunit
MLNGQFRRQLAYLAYAGAADQPRRLWTAFGVDLTLAPVAERLTLARRGPKTVIFVTHDIDEAIKMGHRMAILRTASSSTGRPTRLAAPPTTSSLISLALTAPEVPASAS